MKFGEKLREEREKQGLKIREFARKAKISASYISMLENGALTRDPSNAMVTKMEKALELQKGSLLSFSNTSLACEFIKAFSDVENPQELSVILDKVKDNKKLLHEFYNRAKKE